MSNDDKLADAIRRNPGKDDDELSKMTGIRPRQQVNQIARRLENHGLVRREQKPGEKIKNYWIGGH